MNLTQTIAKKHIPRGFRQTYIPGWDVRCSTLYDKFVESRNQSFADKLLDCLDQNRKEIWSNVTENLDF